MDPDFAEIMTRPDSDWEDESDDDDDIENISQQTGMSVASAVPSQASQPLFTPNRREVASSSRNRQVPGRKWKKNAAFQPQPKECTHPHSVLSLPDEISALSSPLDILCAILKDDIVSSIVEESNRFVTQVKVIKPNAFRKWKELTKEEFWKFWALNLLMGILDKPSIKDYWSTDPLLYTPIFGRTMSRNRFEDILRSLHFVNNENLPAVSADRFQKLGILLPRLNEVFTSLVNAGEYLCIDESLLPHKGRISFQQFNPMKRARFGIKSIELVDCETNILLEILPYQGKTTQLLCGDLELGFGGRSVMTLMRKYKFAGHRLVVDSWYLSPNLAHTLFELDIYVLGTVRKSRKGVPSMTGKLKKGECETYTTDKILVERWMDRREVLMLNTFAPHEMAHTQTRRAINARDKPKTVLTYNKKMGAVDDVDKQIRPYEALRKTIKWYKKFAFYLLDLAVFNTYRSYLLLDPTRRRPRYKNFVLTIIRQILKCGKNAKDSPAPTTTQMHLPICCRNASGDKTFSNCWYCYNKRDRKRKQTSFKCTGCNKRLCIQDDQSCFVLAHQSDQGRNNRENVPVVATEMDESQSQSLSQFPSESTVFSESLMFAN